MKEAEDWQLPWMVTIPLELETVEGIITVPLEFTVYVHDGSEKSAIACVRVILEKEFRIRDAQSDEEDDDELDEDPEDPEDETSGE